MKGINSTAWFLPLIIFELRSSLLSLGRVQASWPLLLLTCSLVGCQTKNISEAQRFEASIRKELPFRIESLRWFDGVDMATYQFANQDYVSTLPDAEIGLNGDVSVYQTFDFQKASRQTEDKVWRNVVVSKKNQRIICIDRYLKGGRTQGYVYVLQCETKEFPTLGKYHWDVSDPHNIESAGAALSHLRNLTLRRIKGNGGYTIPTSQDDYWTLMFHADSLFADGLCPLLNASRVNEWRKEVGLPPIEMK